LTRSQLSYSSPHPTVEAVEYVGGPVTTRKKEEKSTVTTEKQRPAIAGFGMRRKHSAGIVHLEDIEEVDSVLEKDFLTEEAEAEGEETLVDIDGELYKEKEVEIDITDSEPESDVENDESQEGCGVKRKRTIRVIIRSRAFI
jgi:hypothetical protein